VTQQAFFHGSTFSPADDGPRLKRQLDRVREAMQDGEWHTLAELAAISGASEAGASARLRQLRKPQHGGFVVEHERVNGGLWRYRIKGRQVIQ
jgi:hypothetical protein